MTPILTCAQMRAYDRHAIERCAVPSVVLMENAGRGAADVIERLADGAGPVLIVCGRGNNGGDGFVVARHLSARGHAVEVMLVGRVEEVAGDARLNLAALLGLGVPVTLVEDELAALEQALGRAYLCVDALFGTGLARPLEGIWARVIEAINAADCPCVALDIPSGIDADSGRVLGVAVRASVTVTFGHRKTGLLQGAAIDHCGAVHVCPLGIPDGGIVAEVGHAAALIEPDAVAAVLAPRPAGSHKYHHGSVLVVAGGAGKTGAAVLAASAALRAGAGLATIATWPDAAAALDGKVLEVMVARLDPAALEASLDEALGRRASVAVGPGLGLHADARRVVDRLAYACPLPVVLDADAITLLAQSATALRDARGPRILTPHAGELARLLGTSAAVIEADRFEAARTAAARIGQVVVLKGPHTLVAAPDGTLHACDYADPLLGTAGSGDVLTGVVAALAAQAPPLAAALAAVALHARAAEKWRDEVGADRGLLAGDLVTWLPRAIADALGGD